MRFTARPPLDAAHELARQIADNPPLVARGVKGVLELDRAPRVDFGLRHVSAWNAAFLPSEDFAEAVRAFSERCPHSSPADDPGEVPSGQDDR